MESILPRESLRKSWRTLCNRLRIRGAYQGFDFGVRVRKADDADSGIRPFGVSLLVAGWDVGRGSTLYQVDPSGSYWAWKASAIGKNMVNAKTFLEKRSVFCPRVSHKTAQVTLALTVITMI